VRENEPETLAYEWYVSSDGTRGRLFEQYASAEAFRQHLLGRVFTELGHALTPAIRWKSIESFGPLPREFQQILGRMSPENWSEPAVSIRGSRKT
jgi:quinol monooxygenase YgiN